jgi:hypothetical protein
MVGRCIGLRDAELERATSEVDRHQGGGRAEPDQAGLTYSTVAANVSHG